MPTQILEVKRVFGFIFNHLQAVETPKPSLFNHMPHQVAAIQLLLCKNTA